MGLNQYTIDPRQNIFLEHYINPKSKTFSNALQSALKAGYSQEYSENITAQMPDWLSESLGNNKRLQRAEKVLDDTLDMPAVDEEGKVDNALLKTKTDVAKFYAKGLGKEKYSERTEVVGKDGKDLIPQERQEEIDEALKEII
jgi:hypothetical protein